MRNLFSKKIMSLPFLNTKFRSKVFESKKILKFNCQMITKNYLRFFLLFIFFFVLTEGIKISLSTNNKSLELEVEVEIYDVDVIERKSSLNVKVKLRNQTQSYPTLRVLISGGGYAEFYCLSSGYYYEGESGNIEWAMKSFGEFFPFDFYRIKFWIQQIYQRNNSHTLRFEDVSVLSKSTRGRIYPSEDSDKLSELWFTEDDSGRLPKIQLKF